MKDSGVDIEAFGDSDIVQLAQTLKASTPLWVPNEGPQELAYRSQADELFYGGSAGGGKGTPLSANVLTPFGWRKAGELKVGDAICASDGSTQEVLAVFQRGKQPCYRLTWHDGSASIVDADHLWLGWRAGRSRKVAGTRVAGQAGAQIWITKDVYEYTQQDNARRFAIPLISAPCLFNVPGQGRGSQKWVRRSIPPYVLGVLLGDGCLKADSNVFWTKPDEEIAERVESVMDQAGRPVKLYVRRPDDRCISFAFPKDIGLHQELADLDLLGKTSLEKFIPRIYQFGSPEERWELLRGLMDTDGWVEEDGCCYYGSSSHQLALDVMQLARSLGALVCMRQKQPHYTYLGEHRAGETSYTLYIKMRDPKRMFALERKAERCGDNEPQSMAKFLESIEPVEERETVCFVVSNPNRLYIIDDYVVTHNTSLIIGLSLTAHKRSLVLRRTYREAIKLINDYVDVIGSREGWNAQEGQWRMEDGRILDIGGCPNEDDKQKYKGTPHDFIALDEVSDFTESIYRFIITWNRSADPKQRVRVVATGNPPTTAEGLWVVRYWAPWLDPQHPNPAKPGELRWFVGDREVDGPGPHDVGFGEPVRARSRTFIPARMSDNPELANTNYDAVLASLPEELRLAYREGRFDVALKDDAFQVIPTQWVREAQNRWRASPPPGVPMCSMGVDVAGGGKDDNVIAIRHDGWFAPLIRVKGKDTPLGTDIAGLIVSRRRDNAKVVLDCGGGYGGVAFKTLRDNGIDVVAYRGQEKSHGRTHDRQMGFANTRTEAYWRFREALDPAQPGGSPIMLPTDPAMIADLTAPKYEVRSGKLAVTPKEELVKKLGRSPDAGDALVMSYFSGLKGVANQIEWGRDAVGHTGWTPRVIMGYGENRRLTHCGGLKRGTR